MSLGIIAAFAAIVLLVAYRTYGRLLARLFRLDASAPTPSEEFRDDVDFLPTEPRLLLGQHFSAIAAAGPIVGPILAGVMFGWLPALIWIIVGSILIGGVHDLAALVASLRHKARSIAEVVRDHMSPRAYAMFLAFIWLALVYIIVAFADITAGAFVGTQTLENGVQVTGAAVASSSLIYLALPIAMGLLLRFTKIGLWPLTAIFLPLVILAIVVGPSIPLDLRGWLGVGDAQARSIWAAVILVYCTVAAMIPVWLLLQPRGHLGGFFLYFFLAVGVLGFLFGGRTAEYPAFRGWEPVAGSTLAPLLFITIACGAVSGFHALIASGTTSKQLRRETDALPIGYGTMLLEAMVAIISLGAVMMLATSSPLLTNPSPNMIFASGIGGFLQQVGIPAVLAISIMLLAFTTFVYDTLDICTRLGRYVIQELTGWRTAAGGWFATILTAGTPLAFLLFAPQPLDPKTGKAMPAWQVFWQLFGASNQLLAALTLLGITVWMWRTQRARWALWVTGLPCVFMYVMSVWALVRLLLNSIQTTGTLSPVFLVGLALVVLAGLMVLEAIAAFIGPRQTPSSPAPQPT